MRSSGNDVVDPFAFVSASFGGRHLPNQDRLFLCRKERVDVLEHLLEGLPAAVLRTPVIPVDSRPIDVGIAGIVVHRGPVASVGIRDVRTPCPNDVGGTRGNEKIVNVPISAKRTRGALLPLHASSPFISAAKSRKNFLPSALEPFARAMIVCVEAPVDDLGEIDVVGFPIDERDASRSQVCLGDAARSSRRPTSST